MSSFPHLEPEVAQMLQAPQDERIAFCQEDRWVDYPAALEAMSKLDDLHDHPRSLRMPNVLVVARSGNGKSSILEHFCNRHPTIVNTAGNAVVSVLYIEVPPYPNVSSFCSAILWKLGIGHREKDPPKVKLRQVVSMLSQNNVRMLLLDEFNNIAEAGSDAREILATIRFLSNQLKIVIGAAGTQSAINALNQDPQLKSRFQPFPLPAWPLSKKYLQFLAAYERVLPLAKPSGLATETLATKIHEMCGEAIGETVKALKQASVEAIRRKLERITPELLSDISWVAPVKWKDVALNI
jgi:hypothetical protein